MSSTKSIPVNVTDVASTLKTADGLEVPVSFDTVFVGAVAFAVWMRVVDVEEQVNCSVSVECVPAMSLSVVMLPPLCAHADFIKRHGSPSQPQEPVDVSIPSAFPSPLIPPT